MDDFLKTNVKKLGSFFSSLKKISSPFISGWRWGVLGAAIASIAIVSSLGFAIDLGFGKIVDFLASVTIGTVLLYIIFALFYGVLSLLRKLPILLTSIFVASFAVSMVVFLNFFNFPLVLAFNVTLFILSLEGFLGVSLWLTLNNKRHIKIFSFLVVLVLLTNFLLIRWIISPGDSLDTKVVKTDEIDSIKTLIHENPFTKGVYNVSTLTYGSGFDLHRNEYGAEASILTHSVDASFLINDSDVSGLFGRKFGMWWREKHWGFDFSNLPLNGRVWYPSEEGNFPLVLMVHGNHSMEDFSDKGYSYIGELLASRGYIAVSVDQNFLNGSWASSINGENDARGWMLLNHLELWDLWNSTSTSPFYQRVDMDNIALIGHSRGGEAVAIAAAFNKLTNYPDNAHIKFNFNYPIKSIIAIAPTDGQYKPSNKSIELEDINYLVLHGSYDSDVFFFMGKNQYHRISYTGDDYYFKSSLYIDGANHGQFNLDWGRSDVPAPMSFLLNTSPIMEEESQRDIARTYIASFLDTTIKGQTEYIPIFKDYRSIQHLLPEAIYASNFLDSTSLIISNFEEDFDVTTTTFPGGTLEGRGLDLWYEAPIYLKKKIPSEHHGVYLGWNELEYKSYPRYSIILSEDLRSEYEISSQSYLYFTLANTGDLPQSIYTIPDEGMANEETYLDYQGDLLDFTIELYSSDGSLVSGSLSDFGVIPPPIQPQLSKLESYNNYQYGDFIEPVFQSIHIPLSSISEAESNFIPGNLAKIQLIFDRSPIGCIVINEIGIGEAR